MTIEQMVEAWRYFTEQYVKAVQSMERDIQMAINKAKEKINAEVQEEGIVED